MATDYDSPRKTDEEMTEDSLQELQARRMDKSSSTIDVDPDDVAESRELPGADRTAPWPFRILARLRPGRPGRPGPNVTGQADDRGAENWNEP